MKNPKTERIYLYLPDVINFHLCERKFVLYQKYRRHSLVGLDELLELLSNNIISEWITRKRKRYYEKTPDDKKTIKEQLLEKSKKYLDNIYFAYELKGNKYDEYQEKDKILKSPLFEKKINYFTEKIEQIELRLFHTKKHLSFRALNIPVTKQYKIDNYIFILYDIVNLLTITYEGNKPVIFKYVYDNINEHDESPYIFYLEYYYTIHFDIATTRLKLNPNKTAYTFSGNDLDYKFYRVRNIPFWTNVLRDDLKRIIKYYEEMNTSELYLTKYNKMLYTVHSRPSLACLSCPFHSICFNISAPKGAQFMKFSLKKIYDEQYTRK